MIQPVLMGKRGFGHTYRRGRIWWIKYHKEGEPFHESSKSSVKSEADELLKQRIGKATGRSRSRFTVDELLDDLLDYYRTNNPKSVKDFAEPFVEASLRPNFGKYKPHQITTEKLRAYQRKRQDDVANATINREMALLRRAFNLGKLATPRKVDDIPSFPMLPETNVRRGFVEQEQYQNLLEELPEELKALLVVAYHTGCRRGELLGLLRSQVDFTANQIRLYAGETKNEQGRILPIYGSMREWLLKQEEATKEFWPRCRWVFHRFGQPIKSFRESWAQACNRAGLPDLLFHDLRRSAVRNMVRAGIPERVAMAISGHKTRAIFDRYNIVDERDIADAGKKLSSFLGEDI